jgi:hypothetical protein
MTSAAVGKAKSRRLSTGRVRYTYQFIRARRHRYSVQTMCRGLEVARSGYCEWLERTASNPAQEDARLLRAIRASFLASQGISPLRVPCLRTGARLGRRSALQAAVSIELRTSQRG